MNATFPNGNQQGKTNYVVQERHVDFVGLLYLKVIKVLQEGGMGKKKGVIKRPSF